MYCKRSFSLRDCIGTAVTLAEELYAIVYLVPLMVHVYYRRELPGRDFGCCERP